MLEKRIRNNISKMLQESTKHGTKAVWKAWFMKRYEEKLFALINLPRGFLFPLHEHLGYGFIGLWENWKQNNQLKNVQSEKMKSMKQFTWAFILLEVVVNFYMNWFSEVLQKEALKPKVWMGMSLRK